MEKHIYHLNLSWKEGKVGQIRSPELHEKITVATPPEFEKGVAGIWSPEHLFTASVQSCFMTTFLAVAEYSKLDFKEFSCRAEGVLEKADGKYLMNEVILYPRLVIASEDKKEKAQRIRENAEAACLISNSLKTKVSLKADVVV